MVSISMCHGWKRSSHARTASKTQSAYETRWENVIFSSSLGLGRAAACDCGTHRTFLLSFFSDKCAQRRRDSTCAVWLGLPCPSEETLHPWLSILCPEKILRKCLCWSESSLAAHVKRYVFWRLNAYYIVKPCLNRNNICFSNMAFYLFWRRELYHKKVGTEMPGKTKMRKRFPLNTEHWKTIMKKTKTKFFKDEAPIKHYLSLPSTSVSKQVSILRFVFFHTSVIAVLLLSFAISYFSSRHCWCLWENILVGLFHYESTLFQIYWNLYNQEIQIKNSDILF